MSDCLKKDCEPDILEAKAASAGEVALPEKREGLLSSAKLMGTLDVLEEEVHMISFFSSQGSWALVQSKEDWNGFQQPKFTEDSLKLV